MLRHLMTSWHLNIWKVKIWLSQERKGEGEIKNIFRLTRETSKNAADTAFKNFTKSTGKHLCQSPNFIKKETLAQVFSCEFCKILLLTTKIHWIENRYFKYFPCHGNYIIHFSKRFLLQKLIAIKSLLNRH